MPEPIPNHIYTGDCLEVMRSWPDASVDHCIADPPFGIASGRGRGRSKKGLGWAFSSHVTMEETWDQFSEDEYFRFTLDWLREVCRVVRPNGNILVFGTFHNIYLLGFLLGQVLDRRILNSIVWFKPNAQPNITARMLTESTEQLVWAVNETPKRAKNWTFNYWDAKAMNGHKQMRNFWNGVNSNVWPSPVVPASERSLGKHPSQKPRAVVDRLVQLFADRGQLLLDPFAGTGVTGLAAAAYLRKYVLIEREKGFVNVARARLRAQRRSTELRIIEKLKEAGVTLNDRELAILREVPVPQADDLDKVFAVVEAVDAGMDVAADLAGYLDVVGRQGNYYADAALALRLLGIRKDVTAGGEDRFFVTEIGKEYLAAAGDQRISKRRFAVLNSPVVKYVSARLGITTNGAVVPYPPPADLLDSDKVAPVLTELGVAGGTPHRRAKTLTAWLKAL